MTIFSADVIEFDHKRNVWIEEYPWTIINHPRDERPDGRVDNRQTSNIYCSTISISS